MNRLSATDICIGEPIKWDCFDASGNLLLRKGVLVGSARQIEVLIERGLYISQKPATPEVRIPRPQEKASPFFIVEEFKRRLRAIFEGILNKQGNDLPDRILKLAKDMQQVCDMDAEAVLGMLHLDTESRYTITHPLGVAILSELIARIKNLPENERLLLIASALTANISILDLQEQLQKQDGPLTDEQQDQMRKHPLLAVDMLLEVGVSNETWIANVLHHHEKLDGSGYPGAMRGADIPLSVRILSLADTYSAMVTPRIYRTAILAKDALRDIFLKRGGEVDEELAQLFIKVLGVFPSGTFVKLQNGETAIVTRRGENCMKPQVHAVVGPRGAPLQNSIKRDTAQADYAIVEMVPRDRAVKLDVHRMWGYS